MKFVDKDFESLVTISKYRVGAITIRLKIQNAQHHWLKLQSLLLDKTEEILIESLTVITELSVESTPYN